MLLINFISTLGFSLILPFLVFLVNRWGGNAIVYGVVAATYPAWQFIGAPILGRWSDRYGRKRILLLSQIGTLISWIIFAIALLLPQTEIWNFESGALGSFVLTLPLVVVFIARSLDGITGGNISVANAYLTDVTPESERGKNFGKMAMSSNLGFIFGPALAGLLGTTELGELLPVLAAIAISLVGTILVAYYLPETKPCRFSESRQCLGIRKVFGQEQRPCFEDEPGKDVTWSAVLKQKHVPFMMALYFLVFLAFSLFYTAFPNHAVVGLDWTVSETGTFFTVMSTVMVIVQGPVLSRLSTKISSAVLVVVGGMILGVAFILLTSQVEWVIYVGVCCFSLGNGLMWPSYMALLSTVGTPAMQGTIQGYAASVGSIASIIGLIAGGLLYSFLSASTFLASAGIIFVCCAAYLRLPRMFPSRNT